MISLWSLGFDVRVKGNDDLSQSADPTIWPSALDNLRQAPSFNEKFQLESNWIDLLPSLAALLALVPNAFQLGVVIEVSTSLVAFDGLEGFAGLRGRPTAKVELHHKSTVLGFDVLDPRTLTSALSFEPGLTLANGVTTASGKLLASYEQAHELAKYADEQFSEHAPFFAAEIRVWKQNIGA